MENQILESHDIPDEYKDILLIAERKRASKITLIEPISGGRSGAYLFAISEQTDSGTKTQHCILKLYQRKITEKDEYENLRNARVKKPNFSKHLATLHGDFIESKGKTAVFYKIAGNSLQQCRPMSSYVDSSKSLKAIFSTVSKSLLEEWNDNLISSRFTHPQQFLKEWLGYRVKPGEGNIEKFLKDECKMNSMVPGVIMYGDTFPNPLAYARTQPLWGSTKKLDPARGHLHGDLNINNILISFSRDGNLEEYQLIDFAKYQSEAFLFYDHSYLEMSYLIELIANAKFPIEQWVRLILVLAQEDIPDPENVPTSMMGACTAITASRGAFDEWIKAKHPSLQDDFWGQFRLAAVSVGLNFCNKEGFSSRQRWAAFVYAAAHLKRYCNLFGVTKPDRAEELTIQDADLSIDPGRDWQPFLEACHGFDNEYLYILIIGPEDSPDKSLAPLGRVGWSLVIDYDQNSQINGVYKVVSEEISKRRALHLITREEQDELSMNPVFGTYWYAARGLTGRTNTLPSDNTYRRWNQFYTSALRDLLIRFATTSHELPITVVVAWGDVQYLTTICGIIDEVLIERVKFIFVSPNMENLKEIISLYETKIFRLDLYRIAAGISILIGPGSHGDQNTIILPARIDDNRDAQVEIDIKTSNWLLEELTLVHTNLGLSEESSHEPGYNFLRGNVISWFELGLDIDIKRDKTEIIESQILFELENRASTIINLYHHPGAGGTTVARRVAWNLHKRHPTIFINRISNGTIERLSSLYKYLDRPILAVIEHTGFQKETLDSLFASIRARTLSIVLLIVARKFDTGPDTERTKHLPEFLTDNEARRFARVYAKETVPLRKDKVENLAKVESMRKFRTPFYFGLMAFEENFSQLPTYVATRLDGMTDKERKIMCYLALTHFYTQFELPAQVFSNLIGTSGKSSVLLQNVLDKERLSLLVYISEKRGWRTAHYSIAYEICKQIIGGGIQTREHWKKYLSNWAKEFIQHFGTLNSISSHQHSDFVVYLMEEMFLSRSTTSLDITRKERSFARPIIDIQTIEGELAVLECLKNNFPLEPHFGAHYARMLSQQGRHKEAQIEARVAVIIRPHDRVLHHILGIVLRKEVYEIMSSMEKDKRRQIEIDTENLIDMENLFQEAESSFTKARELDIEHEHAYTSHAELLVRGVEFGYKLSGKDTYAEFFNDQQFSKYHEMVGKAEELLDNARRLNEASSPSSYLVNCEMRVDEFFNNDFEGIIRNWRKMLDKSDINAPSIRRRIVRLHLAKNGRSWDDIPVADLRDILDLTEKNILDEPENDWNVKLWFDAARRLPDINLDIAIDRLSSLQARNDTVEVVYHLYILQTLIAIDGSFVAKDRAEKLIEECHRKVLPLSIADQKFRFNWLGEGEGLPRIVYFKKLKKLTEPDWFKYDNSKTLVRVPGKIARISSPRAGIVELRCGLKAFFTPGHERDTPTDKAIRESFVRGRDENKDVDFYLGFSYDGLRAYNVEEIES